MKVVCVDPRTDPLWRSLVEKTESSVFHSPSWIRVLTDTYGWEASAYVIVDDAGEPRAGIPFCRITDMFGERIVALPFSDYCDPLIRDTESWRVLIDKLLPEHCPINLRCLHNDVPLTDERFSLAQHGFLLLAIHGDKIVAGDFFLEWKDTLYYKFNASLPDDLSHRPNDLLIWHGIQEGKKRGLTYLDFGLSDIDQEGLIRYKRKFGTEEKTISFLHYSPNGGPTSAEKEIRQLLGKLTATFTDHLVPDQITEKAGEDLYRLFS